MEEINLEGKSLPQKIKIQSSSTHPMQMKSVSVSFLVHKTFLESHSKTTFQHSAKQVKNPHSLVLKYEKKVTGEKRKEKNSSIQLIWPKPSLRKSWSHIEFEKMLFSLRPFFGWSLYCSFQAKSVSMPFTLKKKKKAITFFGKRIPVLIVATVSVKCNRWENSYGYWFLLLLLLSLLLHYIDANKICKCLVNI